MSRKRIAKTLAVAVGVAICFLWGAAGWLRYGSIAIGGPLIFFGIILLRADRAGDNDSA